MNEHLREQKLAASRGNKLATKTPFHSNSTGIPFAFGSFQNQTKLPLKMQLDNDLRIFFKGLKKKTTRADVLSAFSEFGEVSFLRLPYNNNRNRNLGSGFVVFKNPKVMWHLLTEVKQVILGGKPIDLTLYSAEETKYRKKKKNVAFSSSTIKTHSRDHAHEKTIFPYKNIAGAHPNKSPVKNTKLQPSCITGDLHSIKPSQSRYFRPPNLPEARLETLDHRAGNLLFRLLKCTVSEAKVRELVPAQPGITDLLT